MAQREGRRFLKMWSGVPVIWSPGDGSGQGKRVRVGQVKRVGHGSPRAGDALPRCGWDQTTLTTLTT